MSREFDDLTKLGSYCAGSEQLKHFRISGLSQPALQLLVSYIYLNKKRGRVIIVEPRQRDFAGWTELFGNLDEESGRSSTAVLPSSLAWGSETYLNKDLPKSQRLNALALLASDAPGLILTTPSALAQKTLQLEEFRAATLTWRIGDELDLERLQVELQELGYTPTNTVEESGRFALRGGILDIFPPGRDFPIRCEFFGDSIANLREFSPDTQRSMSEVGGNVLISPAAEAIVRTNDRDVVAQRLYEQWIKQKLLPADRDGMLRSFRESARFPGYEMYFPLARTASAQGIDYLNAQDLVIFPQSLQGSLNSFQQVMEEHQANFQKDSAALRAVTDPTVNFESADALREKLFQFSIMEANNPYDDENSEALVVRQPPTPVVPKGNPSKAFDRWVQILRDHPAVVLCQSDDQITRLKNLLDHREVKLALVDHALATSFASGSALSSPIAGIGYIDGAAWVRASGPLVIPEHAMFERKQIKQKKASQRLKNYLSSFKELKIGALVVHVDHGIGRYCGLSSLTVADIKSDFLLLEYAGGDRVYLPVDKLNLLQRYNAGSDQKSQAPLDRLKSQNWQKRKSRVRKAVRDMADELLKLQAKRAVSQGISYEPLSDDFYHFEADFPYTETDDQHRAIADVNSDMSSPKPMNRLVCGDVGFGKTEIAMRAAFRAVLSGYQVLVLVPTTILCYQHYRTFKARMEKYGVKVAQVNRFVKGPELKEATRGLKDGRVDVLIGTHRLLSKDIVANKLGLLIIDEEQRFGVSHKEKLKQFRAACDILTLTATPIPRTLHMSMLGLRDISIIATPPDDRLSVKTYIAEYNEDLIASAIENEVSRGGQVFFLHNRVEDIVELQNKLKALCPNVSVQHAHGQMNEQKLETVIVDFIEQKFSVLVCTTIIESGIDMPNVNTLIVDHADRFGLAQLYQIRGRVGRSSRQAFAYFLTPPRRTISEDAVRRLDVLAAHQELGSGFQIASHDLEIRGAGNLLGAEQSGKVGEVGLELYTDMLDEAIKELRGEVIEQRIEPEIKLPLTAIISEDYIKDEGLRLELYKRMFSLTERSELGEIYKETADRFGQVPEETALLFKVSALKHILIECQITQASHNKFGAAEFRFAALKDFQIDALLSAVSKQPKIYVLAPDYRLQIFVKAQLTKEVSQQVVWLEELIGLLEPIAMEFEQNS